MLILNLKINPPLAYKIEEKPSNQKKKTIKPITNKLGEIIRNAKLLK
jgi:hypothetical protein